MASPIFAREDDEMHLSWLADRRAGETLSKIARDHGTTVGTVSSRTLAIRRDDAREIESVREGELISVEQIHKERDDFDRAYWADRNTGGGV